MRLEQKWWRDRVQLKHIESHVDKKKDKEGNPRQPTPIEWANIHVDKLADEGYTREDIPDLKTNDMLRTNNWTIYKTVQ